MKISYWRKPACRQTGILLVPIIGGANAPIMLRTMNWFTGDSILPVPNITHYNFV